MHTTPCKDSIKSKKNKLKPTHCRDFEEFPGHKYNHCNFYQLFIIINLKYTLTHTELHWSICNKIFHLSRHAFQSIRELLNIECHYQVVDTKHAKIFLSNLLNPQLSLCSENGLFKRNPGLFKRNPEIYCITIYTNNLSVKK
jgi:hypothetical protein